MGTSSKELARKLDKLASRQHGCFTAAQAIDIGYADSVHLYHVKNGGWTRIYRGVYRLGTRPETPEARCMAALLWTRDKQGHIQGVLSGKTTRSLKNGMLGADEPLILHVPRGFRRSSSVPEGIQLISLPKEKHKSSKYSGMPVAALMEEPENSIPPPPSTLDLPDYYDWLDYQCVFNDR